MAANYDIIVKAVDQTKATFNNIESGLKRVDRQAQIVNKAIGAINTTANTAAIALAALTVKALGYASAINDASENTGVAIQTILALGSALTTNGGEASKAADAVNKFTEAVGTANSGSKELRESFAKVGISLQDLKTLDDTALFEKTLTGLAKIEDATKRNSIQTDIFGKTLKGANIAGFGADIGRLSQAQRDNAAAIRSAAQASDSLKNAFNTIQVAVVRAFKPIADAINNLGQDKINKIADSFLQIAAALTALAGASKVLSVVTSVAAAFGAAWITATVGVAKLTLAYASFTRTLSIAGGYISRYAAGTSKVVTTVGELVGKLIARFPYVLQALGIALGGLLRFIPFVGLLASALYAVNEAVAFAFNVNPLDIFISKAKQAYNAVKDFVFGSSGGQPPKAMTAAEFQRTDKDTTPVPLPLPADRVQKDISLLGSLRENYAKVREEYEQLNASIGKIKDIDFASKVFGELNSRAEELGIVLQKPANILRRDFSLSLEKASEELRITKEELKLADLQALKFSNEMMAAANATTEAKLKFQDLGFQIFMFNNELENSQINLDIQQYRLGLSAQMATKFAQELQATNIELQTNALRLADAGSMSKKFAQEITASQQAIAETALKLGDAQYQQDLFNNNITTSRQVIEQNTITFNKLNEAYNEGTISSQEYSTALRQVDESLLNVTQKTILLNEEYSKIVKNSGDSSIILENLTAQYQTGAISLEEYAKKLSMVSYEYENLSSVTAKAMKGANDEIRTQDLSTQAAKDLTAQLRAGTISWRQYNSAISKLDSTGVQKSFINIESEILRVKTLGEALSDTLNESTKKAGDALADNLTSGIMKGQLRLSSFKDFFGSILNDITAMLIKKQFVSPIVDALTGAMGSGGGMGGGLLNSILGSFGGGGSSGGGLGSIFSGIGDWFGGFFATGGYLPGGKLGIAGEAGPELISGPANITPMDQASGATPIVNFTINAIDTQTGVEFLMKNKPQIIGMVQQGFNSQGQRGIYA